MSAGILFLTIDDFAIAQTPDGYSLNNYIKGFSLILFYSPRCPHSKALLPIFKRLPNIVGLCQFGILNVSANKSIIEYSQSSTTPISYVPYCVLYFGGQPIMLYEGPSTLEDIQRFVVDVSKQLQNKQEFAKDAVRQTKKKIPEYCLGNPLYGDKTKKTYLIIDKAYIEDKNQRQQIPQPPNMMR